MMGRWHSNDGTICYERPGECERASNAPPFSLFQELRLSKKVTFLLVDELTSRQVDELSASQVFELMSF